MTGDLLAKLKTRHKAGKTLPDWELYQVVATLGIAHQYMSHDGEGARQPNDDEPVCLPYWLVLALANSLKSRRVLARTNRRQRQQKAREGDDEIARLDKKLRRDGFTFSERARQVTRAYNETHTKKLRVDTIRRKLARFDKFAKI